MAKNCEIVDEATLLCLKWVDASLLPTLTNAQRDEILTWGIGLFALVFGVRAVLRFFS